eukprot:587023-Hanusia_phi.AAC.1
MAQATALSKVRDMDRRKQTCLGSLRAAYLPSLTLDPINLDSDSEQRSAAGYGQFEDEDEDEDEEETRSKWRRLRWWRRTLKNQGRRWRWSCCWRRRTRRTRRRTRRSPKRHWRFRSEQHTPCRPRRGSRKRHWKGCQKLLPAIRSPVDQRRYHVLEQLPVLTGQSEIEQRQRMQEQEQ